MDLGLHLCAVLSCPRCPLSTVPWSFVQLSSAGISASAYLPRCHVRGPLSPWQKTLLLLCAFRWPQKLHFSCRHCLALCPFLLRLLRIWALELRSPVAFAPMTNGLCCMYFPHGGFIATGCVCLLREAPGKPAWEHELVLQGGEHVGLLQAQNIWGRLCFLLCTVSGVCSKPVWVSLQDQRWPRPILDGSQGPLITQALVPQSPAHLPDDVPGPCTPHSQEAEGVPHLPDLLSYQRHGGESPSALW